MGGRQHRRSVSVLAKLLDRGTADEMAFGVGFFAPSFVSFNCAQLHKRMI
jgi:hypothetical protein